MNEIIRKIEKSINEVNKYSEERINNLLFRALPPGTKREWADGVHEKQDDGTWKKISEPKEKPEAEEPKGEEPEHTTGVPKAITLFEETVRTNDIESMKSVDSDGNLILTKQGTRNTIQLEPKEIESLKNAAVFTHNHPTGNSFSAQDVFVAMKLNIGEMRATGKLKDTNKIFTYSLKPKKGGLEFNQENAEIIFRLANTENKLKRLEFQPLVNNNTLSPQDAEERHWHEIWETLAKEHNFEYRRFKHE